MKRKRGSRGADWERLNVAFKVSWKSRAFYQSLTPEERKRARLTVMLDTLKGEPPEYARLSRLSWSNPDAEHFPEAATSKEAILEALPTLNRGRFLTKITQYELAKAGGRYEAQPAMEHKKKARRKPRRPGKKLASVRAKRHKPRHKKRVRRRRRVPRR